MPLKICLRARVSIVSDKYTLLSSPFNAESESVFSKVSFNKKKKHSHFIYLMKTQWTAGYVVTNLAIRAPRDIIKGQLPLLGCVAHNLWCIASKNVPFFVVVSGEFPCRLQTHFIIIEHWEKYGTFKVGTHQYQYRVSAPIPVSGIGADTSIGFGYQYQYQS